MQATKKGTTQRTLPLRLHFPVALGVSLSASLLSSEGESVIAVRCESMASEAISLRQLTSRLAVGCCLGTKSIFTRDVH